MGICTLTWTFQKVARKRKSVQGAPFPSTERRREPTSVDTRLIEIYEDLANENEEIRIKAASALLAKFATEIENSEEQLLKVVQRLIRGLCSGRKAARIGFSVALTELLSQRWGESHVNGVGHERISDLIDNLINQTEVSGKISGQVCFIHGGCASLCLSIDRKNVTTTLAGFSAPKHSSNQVYSSSPS